MPQNPRHSPEILQALRAFDTATVSNAIEKLALRDRVTGYASNRILCQFPQLEPMVGYAVTATADSTTPGDRRPPRVGELLEALEAAPRPIVLVIQHNGHDRERCCVIGDMFCCALDKLGCVGIVSDANARDKSGIARRTPEFQVFSAGWVASHGYPAYVSFNTPVTVAGLTIQPGDLLHGDESGLIKIPEEAVGSLAAAARQVHDEEAEYFDFLENRFSLDELKGRMRPDKP